MDERKNFERLSESAKDSANRQDEVFNRIEDIVKENPESAKQYLKHLTQTSKLELYGRAYAKFAYITLLIACIIVGLIFSLSKIVGSSEESIIEDFTKLKPEFIIDENDEVKNYIIYLHSKTKEKKQIGKLQNFSPESRLTINKTVNELEVFKNKLKVGSLKMEIDPYSAHFNDTPYKMKSEKSIGDKGLFCFKVLESHEYPREDGSKHIEYEVIFGEKIGNRTTWADKDPIIIKKTDDALGVLRESSGNTHIVTHDKWSNAYIVEMSIGKLGNENLIYFLHCIAYCISLE